MNITNINMQDNIILLILLHMLTLKKKELYWMCGETSSIWIKS
jgi:hypothetical protein